MKNLEFYKLQAQGNDFILIDVRPYRGRGSDRLYKRWARQYCMRKTGVGADGLLLIESSKKNLFKMRIFNPDGSEAEMCGNGARCVAFWGYLRVPGRKGMFTFDTVAGAIETKVTHKAQRPFAGVGIKMVNPIGVSLDMPIRVMNRVVKVNYINTGVPHVVVFVQGLDKIDVEAIGRAIRFHKKFKPQGTNVNFVEVVNDNHIKVRTYERGVEAETFSCGTGSVASAVIWALQHADNRSYKKRSVKVEVTNGEILRVIFDKSQNLAHNVWLQGRVYFLYRGELNLTAFK